MKGGKIFNAKKSCFPDFQLVQERLCGPFLKLCSLSISWRSLFCFLFQSELIDVTEEALRQPSATSEASAQQYTSLVDQVLTAAVSGDDALRDACRERIKSEGVKPPHLLTYARENSGQLMAQVRTVLRFVTSLPFELWLTPEFIVLGVFSGVFFVRACQQVGGGELVHQSHVLVSS